MDKNKATATIEETFDHSFDKETFIRFVKNLLNDIDVSVFCTPFFGQKVGLC
jgi:hypothetical protein